MGFIFLISKSWTFAPLLHSHKKASCEEQVLVTALLEVYVVVIYVYVVYMLKSRYSFLQSVYYCHTSLNTNVL